MERGNKLQIFIKPNSMIKLPNYSPQFCQIWNILTKRKTLNLTVYTVMKKFNKNTIQKKIITMSFGSLI